MSPSGLHVVVVGLEFGAEFVPIYQVHPDVTQVSICDTDPVQLDQTGARFGITNRYASLEEALADPGTDAVHLVTPIGDHGRHSIQVLEAGKHCACTIPVALDLDEIQGVVDATRRSGTKYMLMETAVYTREYLYVEQLVRSGAFGRITFGRGAHLQDMTGWPDYWIGFPPIAHITHAIAPVLALLQTHPTSVVCFGSGTLPAELSTRYGNPFPAETALFRLADSDVAVEVSRSMFEMARPYTESFALYGTRLGFEWQQIEEDQPLLFTKHHAPGKRGARIEVDRIDAPDQLDRLPESLRPWTRQGVYGIEEHLSVLQGGGHGGSHPHLVHEFVSSIVEDRTPAIDVLTAARWSASGVCAHQSALAGGTQVTVPSFDH